MILTLSPAETVAPGGKRVQHPEKFELAVDADHRGGDRAGGLPGFTVTTRIRSGFSARLFARATAA